MLLGRTLGPRARRCAGHKAGLAAAAIRRPEQASEFSSATGHEQLQRTFTGIFKAMSFGRELHVDRIIEAGGLTTAQTLQVQPLAPAGS